MKRQAVVAGVLLIAGGCSPNPRSEMAAIASAALEEARRTSTPGMTPCVRRVIAPWRLAGEAGRVDPPAPPGFDGLLASGVFRGGGGLKGSAAGGVPIRDDAGCLDLRGPLVRGDRAMVEGHLPGIGWNAWLRRDAGDWRVVMTSTSQYPGEARADRAGSATPAGDARAARY